MVKYYMQKHVGLLPPPKNGGNLKKIGTLTQNVIVLVLTVARQGSIIRAVHVLTNLIRNANICKPLSGCNCGEDKNRYQ